MSQNKVVKTVKTKSQFIAENLALYSVKFNFLPAKQIKGKLEEDWRKLYGPKRVKQTVKVVPQIAITKPAPTVIIKPEILITPVPQEQLKPTNIETNDGANDEKMVNGVNDNGNGDRGDVDDHHHNKKQIKRKHIKEESNQLKSKKDKLETTIELLTEDNKSIGFIESKGSDTYLKLHSGKLLPWSHSTPVRVTRNNSHRREISRLPFSPI